VKLVPDWRQSWKWISVHAQLAQVAIVGTWTSLPEDMRAAVPGKVVLLAVGIVGAAGVLGRLVDQGSGHAPAD
jgi:hypothetical protein